jgi:hypothetical protein
VYYRTTHSILQDNTQYTTGQHTSVRTSSAVLLVVFFLGLFLTGIRTRDPGNQEAADLRLRPLFVVWFQVVTNSLKAIPS